MSSTLLVLTLNEIDGMKAMMPRVKPEWVDQILVADGGSTDGTVEWARAQGYDVVICGGKGLTRAYLAAWPEIRGDTVIYFSPDGNSIPEAIPDLIQKMEKGYDMVIASRYLGSAKSDDDDRITAFGNLMFRTLINFFFKPKESAVMADPLVMFRAHKRDIPQQLGINRIEPLDKFFGTHSCWIPLLSMVALKKKIRWTEIPVDEPVRIAGRRKLQILRYGALHLTQIFREFWRG
ncbi:MAG: glycosyltransferase family 2 protein [Deltaproteobacteria bacterium]|nr:glycosyltransferase family 2 protein [Deltaproteobacteria bacterium]